MTAADDLAQLEQTTDWRALIELALGDPPKPEELLFRFNRWSWAFERVYGGAPLPPDYPPGMEAFIKRLAFADIPPALIQWAEEFESEHCRRPKKDELPAAMRKLLPKPGNKGRPRCDTKQFRDAARAWEAEIFRQSYELRRELIAIGKEMEIGTHFGFEQPDIQGDRPSSLALEKLSEETGKSSNYLLDIIFPRRKKRQK